MTGKDRLILWALLTANCGVWVATILYFAWRA
jgi:hypothetical protein